VVRQSLVKEFQRILGKDQVPGGALSGEPGMGAAKARFLEKEFGPVVIIYFKRIKAALDPHNILNPGKIIGD
jgi:glycolate oxidase